MATTCTPAALVTDAGCLVCLDDKVLLSIIAKTLCTIAGMSCTPETLASDSKCFTCLDNKQLLAVIAKLLCDILAAGGTGGGGGVLCGDVNPVAAPTGTCSLYINLTDSTLWYWDNTATAWILFG